ncbi:FKBP-type peptidyl-prolyl cis-trans isomerase [Flavobacterium sp. AJR]|jgi:FKBP-type peptidyl-prolyl cis-trans isomerase|uniref:FKBP-type peptidyl-prolyl cis-trans isomerase n=1 Tax=Flavobacterium sp. AJR TaxID=1979369 RepID=UPI000A3D6AF8|nr:FKBP-type peptidylprolyl isomerase [Flavobacterium sp. AJR]OUL62242.1 FKBP-type peptidylprolyl isomerase [Flavobacterium sp. AJR]
MNKFKYYFILTFATLAIFSCSKSDSADVEPLRDFQVQYDADIAVIEDYLKTNTITITEAAGKPEDQDVKIKLITKPNEEKSIWFYLNSPTFPTLKVKTVNLHNVDYKLYYLVLREGTGESPSNVDGVLSSYNGTYLFRKAGATTTDPSVVTATQFEEIVFPQTFYDLYQMVKGWGETFPEFKVGTSDPGNNGTIVYNDFGAGVMFLPSGLGYYAGGSGSIPSYSPLVFSFKLYALQRLDHDGDGVFSYQEDKDGDGYVRDMRNTTEYPNQKLGDNPDDTDKDGIPDFLDVDDDGDGYTTKFETKRPDTVIGDKTISNGYYPFNGAAVDDPATEFINETHGIPAYIPATKTFDYTSPTRIRVHLDSTYPLKK